tara:strand:- start:2501 stop:2824 length:324 start_codon:yes stop_codon:yes gene_type:complete
MIVVCKYLVLKGYNGITLFPFIILRHYSFRDNKVLINHERIHLKQQLELLVIGFYLWYIIEFLVLYVKYKNWNKAYRNISFEQEAYSNESDLMYLKDRPLFAFLKFY